MFGEFSAHLTADIQERNGFVWCGLSAIDIHRRDVYVNDICAICVVVI